MRIYFRPHENYSASPEAMTARIAETERAHAPRVLYSRPLKHTFLLNNQQNNGKNPLIYLQLFVPL